MMRDSKYSGCAPYNETIKMLTKDDGADPITNFNNVFLYKCPPGYVMDSAIGMTCREWLRNPNSGLYYNLWNILPGGVHFDPCYSGFRDPLNNYECSDQGIKYIFQGVHIPECT